MKVRLSYCRTWVIMWFSKKTFHLSHLPPKCPADRGSRAFPAGAGSCGRFTLLSHLGGWRLKTVVWCLVKARWNVCETFLRENHPRKPFVHGFSGLPWKVKAFFLKNARARRTCARTLLYAICKLPSRGRKLPDCGRKLPDCGRKVPPCGRKVPLVEISAGKNCLLKNSSSSPLISVAKVRNGCTPKGGVQPLMVWSVTRLISWSVWHRR